MPTVSKFVKYKPAEDGGQGIYFFKMNDYMRARLNEIPNNSYVYIGASQWDEGTNYMSYSLPKKGESSDDV